MNTDVKLGRVAGIPIGLNWSLLLIFGLITWSLASAVLPGQAPGQSGAAYWLVAVIIAVLFLASIVVHELAHAIVASRSGQHVEGITLWLFGGVSKLGGDAGSPGIEARIAIVGPLTSFAAAVVFGLCALGLAAAAAPALWTAGLFWLAAINVTLGAFNLVPGFPLDGGRVLRAALWHRSGNRIQATARAARAGRAVGLGLMGIGLLEFIFSGSVIGGLWLIFIGWFLRGAASAEESAVVTTGALAGLRVSELMSRDPVTLPGAMTVEEFLWKQPFQHRFTTFPIVEVDGSLLGLLSLRRMLAVPESERSATRLSEIAVPMPEVHVASPEALVGGMLEHFGPNGAGRVLVTQGGHLVGIVSPRDVAQAIEILTARGQHT